MQKLSPQEEKEVKYKYELIQDGMIVATIFAPTKKQGEKEINHYALIYSQDGPVKIKGPKKCSRS